MANIDILTGLNVVGQFPLNPKIHFKTLGDLVDLGASDVNAFTYHQSMVVMVYENNKQYIWRTPDTGEIGEMPNHFVYPNGSIADGVDYSGLSYNFFEFAGIDASFDSNIVLVGDYFVESDYTYGVWASKYIIATVVYSNYISDSLVVPPGHATLDRIDLMVINNNETFSLLPGTPALVPAPPSINLDTQVAFAFVFVKFGSTSPEGVVIELIYDENVGEPTEWTLTSTVGDVDPDFPTDPSTGAKCIKFDRGIVTGSIRYDNDVLIPRGEDVKLVFDVKIEDLITTLFGRCAISNGTYGRPYTFSLAQYGLDLTNTGDWQTCTIPLGNQDPWLPSFNYVVFSNLDGKDNFKIDNIRIQSGLPLVEGDIHPQYTLEETASTIKLLKDNGVVSTVSKGITSVTIFTHQFSLRKGIGNLSIDTIEVGDIAMNGIFDANEFIKYMLYTNDLADNDTNNRLNWNIIETL